MRIFAALVLALASFLSQAQALRATDLLGAQVANPAGKSLGEVKDVIFNSKDGSIRSVTVQFSLGGKEAAFSAAQLVPRGDRLVLDVAQETLRHVPAFDHLEWPAMRASALLNKEVRDRLHRDAGEIVDLVVRLDQNHVSHAVLDLADDWKPGQRLVEVGIGALALPRDLGERIVLNISRQELLKEGR